MKAVIYARVSTTMQEEHENLKFQIQKCKDFCKFKEYEIKKIIQDVESGGKDTRIGFLELQEEVEKANFDVLVVYESSRISRKTITMINFVNILQENDIKFISISQPELDTTSATGELFFSIQASLGQYERKLTAVRVKSGKWSRIKVGEWQGGVLPLGYKKEDVSSKIIIDEENAKIVKQMFQMYINTQSLRKVSKFFKRPVESISWIMRNPFYIGILRYGKKENNINTGKIKVNDDYQYFQGKHPSIIDDETFELAQKILISNKRDYSNNYKLLFSSILTCSCSGKMYSQKRATRYDYRCDKCSKTISSKIIEPFIIEELFKLKELEDLDDENIEIDKYRNDIEEYKKQIETLKKEKNKYIVFCAKNMITEKELESFIKEINPKILFLNGEIGILSKIIKNQKISGDKENNLQMLHEVLKNMEDMDRGDLNRLFKLLIQKIDFINREPLKVKIYIK